MIVGVSLNCHEVEAETVAGNSHRAGTGKGVEDGEAVLGMVSQNSHQKVDRFLGRVDAFDLFRVYKTLLNSRVFFRGMRKI